MLSVLRPSYSSQRRTDFERRIAGNSHQTPPAFFWVILVDSGTFLWIDRAKGQPKMICRQKSLKHIPGQFWNALLLSELAKN